MNAASSSVQIDALFTHLLEDENSKSFEKESKHRNIPVIRNFQSLMTDDQFARVGLQVSAGAKSNTALFLHQSHSFSSQFERTSITDENPTLAFGYTNASASLKNSILTQSFFCSPAKVQNEDDNAAVLNNVHERIEELRVLAVEDGIKISDKSVDDALAWFTQARHRLKPSIYLLENGNVRFLWRNGDSQIGIQFLGNELAQFVSLGDKEGKRRLLGSLAIDEINAMWKNIDLSNNAGEL